MSKGFINNKLREKLMIQDPPITTKAELKQAVAHAQVGILQYARTFNNPPPLVTAGLGSLQKDGLETRRKTNEQVAELHKQYRPRITSSADKETPMELDAMQRAEEEEEEEYDNDNSEEEADDALFFMEPEHDKIRA